MMHPKVLVDLSWLSRNETVYNCRLCRDSLFRLDRPDLFLQLGFENGTNSTGTKC